MPPSDRWPVGLVAGVARALAAFAAAVRGRSSSRRWRARSACRAVCALPRLRAAVAPVVWLAGRGGEECCILQRPHAWGTGTRLPALRSPPLAAIQPKPRGKAKGGRFHPRLYTKFCVQKIPGQKNTGRGRRGTAPARKTGGNEAQNPLKCHQIAPALTRGGQRGIPNPQTASRTAENGLSNVVAPSVRPIGVRSSRAGDVVQIMPPAVRANVIDFARAAHSAHVKFAIRGALVG